MKKKLGIISIIIFILSAALGIREYFFIGSFFPGDTVTSIVIFFLATGLPPVIGLIFSFFSKKGDLKIIGMIGNGAVMILTIVWPLTIRILLGEFGG
ncbi:hypothetical protein A3863_07660 (plasmid) [Priestia endophytica]|uniref:hypothetical protein n=1 Tax=Priestia endophytica TaxID=135735 RepID=UPI000DCA702D|nr:hypothetical protein [Priestia endophytica]RAS90851.1 hypothetical protein A3863_07660 [Priestia endophytica]